MPAVWIDEQVFVEAVNAIVERIYTHEGVARWWNGERPDLGSTPRQALADFRYDALLRAAISGLDMVAT